MEFINLLIYTCIIAFIWYTIGRSDGKKSKKITDTELNQIRDEYCGDWERRNPTYPGTNDYLSGINDGLYHLRNKLEK
jgi:hypothetical protein